MDKVKKAAWIADLRSGEYQQTTGALCHVDYDGNRSFCCLGVLSDQARAYGIGEWSLVPVDNGLLRWTDVVNGEPMSGGGVGGYYTKYVRDWAGMNGDEAENIELEFTDPRQSEPINLEISLANLNDDGLTFDQIADVIDYFL